jgi:ABC-type Fe3+/spermidine/putrescine transport system ATPase subunit
LVIEPDVLLLDEPLSNLDAKLRNEMREEILRIQGELGITTVYVTHDQIEALSISDMVAVMDKGYVQQFAPPREIYDNPQTLFVADFIGKCTFLDGKISDIGQTLSVKLSDGQVIKGITPLPEYPFEMNEPVRCAVRPEDLHTKPTGPNDNMISGEVYQVVFIGSNIEVHFKVGDVIATSLLPPEFDVHEGSAINLHAPASQMMILPMGGVDALRKIPGHPLYSASDQA